MSAWSGETRFLAAAFLVLFVGLGILSVFLLTGESSRARILIEYEADRTASTLADAYRVGSLDRSQLDPRVRGFGLYASDGEAVVRAGDAPDQFDFAAARPGFSYDPRRGLLMLERVFGMGPGMMAPGPEPGGPGMMPGPLMGRGMMRGMMGGGPGPVVPQRRGGLRGPGAFFLSMDISGYYRSQRLYRTAAVAAPLVVAGLASLFLFLLFSNIRNRRRLQEQETLARLGESARTLAHEIRNPLGAIRIQTGLLRKKMPSGAFAQLDVIDEEVERLSLLSRRVGDFLRNPRGTPQRIVLHEFLQDLAPRLPAPVSYEAAADARAAAVSCDGGLLRSVMENLVRNALESYPEDDGRRPVDLALFRDKGSVVVAVRDRGKGIPADLREKVFDPFFTDKAHGSGVGLALSRRFIEAAGGTIELLPRPGGGTEARVTLPAGGAR